MIGLQSDWASVCWSHTNIHTYLILNLGGLNIFILYIHASILFNKWVCMYVLAHRHMPLLYICRYTRFLPAFTLTHCHPSTTCSSHSNSQPVSQPASHTGSLAKIYYTKARKWNMQSHEDIIYQSVAYSSSRLT